MPIRTKRWNDKREADDGLRILVCRTRPRAVSKKGDPWHLAWNQLSPSKQLQADFDNKTGIPINLEEYRRRYLQEMEAQSETIDLLAEKVGEGKTITLLCSSACTDKARCHRTLLQGLIEDRVAQLQLAAPAG